MFSWEKLGCFLFNKLGNNCSKYDK